MDVFIARYRVFETVATLILTDANLQKKMSTSQAKEVEKVKRAEGYVIDHPYCIGTRCGRRGIGSQRWSRQRNHAQ